MRLLTALGQDVDIMVRTKPSNRARGRIRVIGEAHVCGHYAPGDLRPSEMTAMPVLAKASAAASPMAQR